MNSDGLETLKDEPKQEPYFGEFTQEENIKTEDMQPEEWQSNLSGIDTEDTELINSECVLKKELDTKDFVEQMDIEMQQPSSSNITENSNKVERPGEELFKKIGGDKKVIEFLKRNAWSIETTKSSANKITKIPKTKKFEKIKEKINLITSPKTKKVEIIEKNPKEKIIYKCTTCEYSTPYSNAMKSHELTHKSICEVTSYKCNFCEYTTKFKQNVTSHMKKHSEEAKKYKCEICSFQTKYKASLTVHLKLHKSNNEVEVFKCESCSYETKFRGHLKSHLLQHKSNEELTLFSCEICSFQTKFKSGLNQHMLKHKDASECVMNKCELCSFETKYKYYFKKHLKLIHNQDNTGDNVVFKCQINECTYETTCKSYFQKHLKKRHKPEESNS